jgi:hypothetical protein
MCVNSMVSECTRFVFVYSSSVVDERADKCLTYASTCVARLQHLKNVFHSQADASVLCGALNIQTANWGFQVFASLMLQYLHIIYIN